MLLLSTAPTTRNEPARGSPTTTYLLTKHLWSTAECPWSFLAETSHQH